MVCYSYRLHTEVDYRCNQGCIHHVTAENYSIKQKSEYVITSERIPNVTFAACGNSRLESICIRSNVIQLPKMQIFLYQVDGRY